MNGTQTFILECGRINSVGVSGGGEDFDNKSSWTNQTAPILLKQGDNVSLQNVLINVGGADTNSIQFQGVSTSPTQTIQDNFTLMKVGFYVNHNGIYTASLPLTYQYAAGAPDGYLKIDDNQEDNNRTNNSQGKYHNYNYFQGTNDQNELTDAGERIARIDKIRSLNPFSPMNGSKFAVIHPDYTGWARSNDGNGNSEDQVNNIKLLEQDIPILLPQGFVSPTGLADLVTNILSYTKSNAVRDPDDIITATANKYKQDEGDQADKVELKQYAVNGYTYKTIKCNLLGDGHKIYGGGMCVDEPFRWLYGTQILSNAETDNMALNKRYFNQNNNPDDARVDYPVMVWQRFIGDDTTDFDLGIEGRTGQYSNYSPFTTTIDTSSGTDILEISGMSSNYSGFNDYFSITQPDNTGMYLAQVSSNSFQAVRNDVMGSGISNFGFFVDNDNSNYTDIVAWRRFTTLSGNWPADEHQIFKTTNVGTGNQNPYQFSGAGAGQPSETFFTYTNQNNRTIFMGQDVGGLGFSSYVYLFNALTADSGGIVEGGHYTISFDLEIQQGYSWNNTNIGVGGNGVGLSFTTFNSNGSKSVEFDATASSIAANAIAFGVYYSNLAAVVKVSNISILRDNLNQNDTYAVANVWTNNTTNKEDNKIYSITKNNGLSNLQLELTDNTSHTYFNRTYTVIARGLIANFSNGNFVCSNNLTTHDPNVAILYNDDETDYTFWIFQTSNPDLWILYRLEKYQGGIPENNTILGAIDGAGIQIKNPSRAGQQYYDFSVGNVWTGSTKNILKDIPNPFDTTSTFTFDPAGADVHYTYYADDAFEFEYLANETQTWKYVQSILTENVVANETFTISFDITNITNPGNPLAQPFRIVTSYLEGAVNYNPRDFTAEGNHSFTFTTTQAPFNQSTSIYWGFYNNHPNSGDEVRISNFRIEREENISITSHIAQTLPTVDTGGVAGVVQYFASFDIHVSYGPNPLTLYLGANDNGNGNDTDKEGKRGRLVWLDGANWNATSWDWNDTDHIDLDIDGGVALYYQGSAPSLTNIVQYDTSQDFVVNANTYAVPIDGKQYGLNYQVYGNTNTSQVAGTTEYLGFNSNTDYDDLIDITEGFVYDNLNDSFANNNGKKWKLEQVGDGYKLVLTQANDGVVILSLFDDGSNMLIKGWSLLRSDKKLDSEISASGTNGVIFTNITKLGYFSQLIEPISDNRFGPDTDEDTGVEYQVFESADFSQVADRGDFKTHIGANLRTQYADLRQHQLLMTNINCTENNLDKIKNFFRYNEFYFGTENTRTSISNDTRNFVVNLDVGRSDDSYLDFNQTNASQNQTGRRPYIPNYLRDQGFMGVDNGDQDTISMGGICPIYHNSGKNENRINVFTGWLDGYENRIIADGMYGNIADPSQNGNYCYGNSITTDQFKSQYIDLYNKCKNENIGIIPFINKETGHLMIGFEVYSDYIGTLFKIQNLSWFGFSPSTIDHKYVMLFNNDAPSIKDSDGGDYNYTGKQQDQMNFIQVGATQPAMEYNNDLNKFTLRYFHTPTFFNKATGTETNIGQEIAKIFDNSSMVIFRDHCYQKSPEKLADDDRRNVGINDSQSGIFIHDIYFQKVQNNNLNITDSSDDLGVLMTRDNFYNTLWFKLGFSYYDLKPIRFKNGSFNNSRFNNLTYNNISAEFRNDGIVPFTTNSLFNINFAPLMNIFSQNSGTVGTENPNKGTEIYGLGFNNNVSADVQVESDSLFPASIPVNISSGYYRIYTDLPIDTLTYTSGGSNLAVIGSALLNYASSQQFFFSYGMDYGATITKDTLINNIKIEIRDDRGLLVKGLGDRSLVVIKITRAIQLTEPPPDPNTKELQDIEDDLEELVQETKEDNLKDDLRDADNEINQVGIGDAIASTETKSQIDTPEEISNFIDNFNIQMIQNLVSRTLVRAGDDSKDVGKRVANGIAQYFLRKDNIKEFNKITKDLFNEGIDATLAKPYVAKFVDSMNKFYINVDGKALKGARRQPEVATISDEGALILYDKIAQYIQDNPKPKVGGLSATLFENINNLFGTDDIKIYDQNDPGIVEALPAQPVKDELDIEDFEVKKVVERGFKEKKRGELKKLFLDYGNLTNYLNLYGFVTQGVSPEDKKEAMEEIEDSGPDLDQMEELYREAGKAVLKDNPVEFVRILTQLNTQIEDVIGTRLYEKFDAILEENQNVQALTGITAQKGQQRLRRQQKEVDTAKDMAAEDKDAIESAIKRKDTPHDRYFEKLKAEGKVKTRGEMRANDEYRKEFNRLRVDYFKNVVGRKYGGKVEKRLVYQSPVGFESEGKTTKSRRRRPPTPEQKEGGASK